MILLPILSAILGLIGAAAFGYALGTYHTAKRWTKK